MTKDAYTWSVLYKDGTTIQEYDHPDGHGFAVVDSTRVRALTLTSPVTVHSVEVPDGASPVFFRRRSIALQSSGGGQATRNTVHCIGWKQEDRAVYLFVGDDGSTLLTSDLQSV